MLKKMTLKRLDKNSLVSNLKGKQRGKPCFGPVALARRHRVPLVRTTRSYKFRTLIEVLTSQPVRADTVQYYTACGERSGTLLQHRRSNPTL